MNPLIKTVGFIVAGAWSLSAGVPTVWVFDSLTRVAPTDPAGTQEQMTLYAGRGEYQSLQIGVQAPSGGLTNVNVTASSLTGPGGATIPAANLSLFREQYVPIAHGQTSNGSADGKPCTECPLGPGTYADGLIPFVDPDTGLPPAGPASLTAVPFALTAGQNQPIWVDVLVPRTAVPGIYTGAFTITSDQGQSQVSLTLNVWSFTLPLRPSMNSAFLVTNAAYNSSTNEELMRNRLMPDSTMNVAEATTLNNSFGLGDYGIEWFSGAVYGSCSTNEAAPTISQAQTAAAPFQQLGLVVYDYSFDEIDACTNLYPTIIQWAQNLHQAGINQLITMAPVQALFNDGLGTGRSAVDIWTMLPDAYVAAQSQNPPMVTAALAKGDQVWAYQTLIQDDYSPKWLIDFAPVGMRAMAGFLSQSLGFTGLLYWEVDGWLSGTAAASWTNVFFKESGTTFPGEGILVYPGDAVGMPNKVAPSMRLKQLRDGEQDYEYIQLLKTLGQGTYALQVASTVAASYTNWSQNPATLQAARITLGQTLNTLTSGTSQVAISAGPSSLTFTSPVNGPANPASENIALSVSSGASMNFTVAVQPSGPWLTATSAQGATPSNVGITVNPSGLIAGIYTGSVTVTVAGASNSPLIIPVTLTVDAQPAIDGMVNAASFAKTSNGRGSAVAPGSLVAIFTSNLATSAAASTTASLPKSLEGVSVTLDGFVAPIVSVTPTGSYPYVSVQVPFEVLSSGQTSATVPVVLSVNGVASAPVQTPIVQSAPGIFTIPPTGAGNGILVFLDPSDNFAKIAAPTSASSTIGFPTAPIPPGTGAFFYATGLGAMTPSVADGSGTCPAPNSQCPANSIPTVLIGGVTAPVSFAGQAPGFPGVSQINIAIPQNAPAGNSVSLVVKSADGTVTSNTATIAIQ